MYPSRIDHTQPPPSDSAPGSPRISNSNPKTPTRTKFHAFTHIDPHNVFLHPSPTHLDPIARRPAGGKKSRRVQKHPFPRLPNPPFPQRHLSHPQRLTSQSHRHASAPKTLPTLYFSPFSLHIAARPTSPRSEQATNAFRTQRPFAVGDELPVLGTRSVSSPNRQQRHCRQQTTIRRQIRRQPRPLIHMPVGVVIVLGRLDKQRIESQIAFPKPRRRHRRHRKIPAPAFVPFPNPHGLMKRVAHDLPIHPHPGLHPIRPKNRRMLVIPLRVRIRRPLLKQIPSLRLRQRRKPRPTHPAHFGFGANPSRFRHNCAVERPKRQYVSSKVGFWVCS